MGGSGTSDVAIDDVTTGPRPETTTPAPTTTPVPGSLKTCRFWYRVPAAVSGRGSQLHLRDNHYVTIQNLFITAAQLWRIVLGEGFKSMV